MAKFDLTGKVALVAGASRGIGEAIAHGLAEQGAIVVCTSRKQADCEVVAAAIRAKGGQAISGELHLGELSTHDKILSMIENEYGRLDILINNGATNPYFGPVHKIDEDSFDKTFNVNLRGPFFLTNKAYPLLRADGGGSVVNVSSIDGVMTPAFRVTYGMTKAALISMTKGMAKEFAPKGVRVNALLPGLTDTKLASALKNDPQTQAFMAMNIAMNRMAQPDEMVGAVLFMVSDEASYFTGQSMIVDGGYVMR